MRTTVKNSVWSTMKRTDDSTAWRRRVSGSAAGSMAAACSPRRSARIERTSSAKRASLFSKYQ